MLSCPKEVRAVPARNPAPLGFIRYCSRGRFAGAWALSGPGSAQQRSVHHCPLTFLSVGPCDRGNLCLRRPAGAGWRAGGVTGWRIGAGSSDLACRNREDSCELPVHLVCSIEARWVARSGDSLGPIARRAGALRMPGHASRARHAIGRQADRYARSCVQNLLQNGSWLRWALLRTAPRRPPGILVRVDRYARSRGCKPSFACAPASSIGGERRSRFFIRRVRVGRRIFAPSCAIHAS
jgi:hypothetical protein